MEGIQGCVCNLLYKAHIALNILPIKKVEIYTV